MDVASPLLSRACAVLDAAGVRWAVLRGAETLGVPAGRLEVDLLVGPQDMRRLPGLLAPLGFRPRRAWGHAPHRFLDALDGATVTLLTLDAVDRLCYGRPVRSLGANHAAQALDGRERHGELWTLTLADEFATLLLHALLDKPAPAAAHRARLATLWRASAGPGARDTLLGLVASMARGAVSAPVLAAAMESDDWTTLLEIRPRLRRRLFWSAPLATTAREIRGRAGRALAAVWRRLPRTAAPQSAPAASGLGLPAARAPAPSPGERRHG
jgi:hypothetical protein